MRINLRGPLLSAVRLLSLLALASFGTVLLVRSAPGYFTHTDELDAQHSGQAREQVVAQREHEGSALHSFLTSSQALLRGDLGQSHQYGVPVSTLLGPRLRVTGRLLLMAAVPAPLLALFCAVPCSQMRAHTLERGLVAATLVGVAVPVSVLAGVCLLSGVGGPIAVLFVILAVRDFRFFSRLLRRQSKAPYLLYARAYGVPQMRGILHGVLQPVRGEIFSLVALSFVTALSAAIPIEVIFGIPGVGQMAWNAAMNRDLPVLLAVTLLMAACVGTVDLAHRNLERSAAGIA
ncbi:MAG: ABC transporter permease subunit [Janthinobacterium lividum]